MTDPFAVTEVGTNSAKLVIARQRAGGFEQLDFVRRTTGLGRGLARGRRIERPDLEVTLDVMREFARAIGRARCGSVFAYATWGLRRAANRGAVAARIGRVLGVTPRVLSGREEARFAYRSARDRLALRRPHTILCDIGGGSTEIVVGRRDTILASRSLPVGALALTERFLAGDPPDKSELADMTRRIERVLQPVGRIDPIHRLAARDFDLAACGGGASALLWMNDARLRRKMTTLRAGDVRDWLDRCASLPLAARSRIRGLEPDRARIIVAGTAILLAVMRLLHKRVVVVNTGGVREGVIAHLIDNGLRW